MGSDICFDRGILLVNNPYTGTDSLRTWLGFNAPPNHGFPTVVTPFVFWNRFSVVVMVREPVLRALACFRHVTSEHYAGDLLNRYSGLQEWDADRFFDIVLNRHVDVCGLQHKYTQHMQSNKRPDFLLRYENADTTKLAQHLDIPDPFPIGRVDDGERLPVIDEKLYLALVEYFKVDYFLLGYRPKEYSEFMKACSETA